MTSHVKSCCSNDSNNDNNPEKAEKTNKPLLDLGLGNKPAPKKSNILSDDELFASPKKKSCCADKQPAPVKSCCAPPPEEKTPKSCCSTDSKPAPEEKGGCCGSSSKFDWLLWGSFTVVVISYLTHFSVSLSHASSLGKFIHGVVEMMNKMWLGLGIGILAVGFLGKVPRSFIQGILGKGGSMSGILRATGAGLLLDLCNHGILLVAMKLHERGASLGQTFAFLIASPWNSISMTVILWSLIGWQWTLTFIALSAVIGILTGWITDKLIPPTPAPEPETSASPWQQAKEGIRKTNFNRSFFRSLIKDGWRDSRSIMKWIFFGAVLAAAVRTIMTEATFADWFGPGLAGIGLTFLAATLIEVCSEGSSPLAADLVTRAAAPGNGFAFLMAGAATDYTEIMALKETTKSWKRAFLLPALTLPQVAVCAYLLNTYA